MHSAQCQWEYGMLIAQYAGGNNDYNTKNDGNKFICDAWMALLLCDGKTLPILISNI